MFSTSTSSKSTIRHVAETRATPLCKVQHNALNSVDINRSSASASISDRHLSNFKVFGKLPIELRIKIWKMSLQPRVIEMRFANNIRSTQYDFVSPKLPATVYVNSEARQECRKLYEMSFAHIKCGKAAYFNPHIDIVHIRGRGSYFDGHTLKQIVATLSNLPDKDKIKHISISNNFWPTPEGTGSGPSPPILLFPFLETVTISWVINHRVWDDACEKHSGPCNTQYTGGSCFADPATVERSIYSAGHGISQKEILETSVGEFLSALQQGKWGEIKWDEPQFEVKGLCVKNYHSGSFHCPPLGLGKAAAKRQAIHENLLNKGILSTPTAEDPPPENRGGSSAK
ncbi:hypothetical protein EG329_011586 [Mollisiaceae sp. DMI_Dod_QoI]|nr:hypothetical protein EG329_011586 [Helotiales sp. DMI_Dod_QoI]